ncbi:hypothetical protein [Nocardia mexicana]|uniref:Uncharacterized protein n=1 Tax=Nocardia mexicana TaxID=279262 RepID=A0A370GRJ0_9NOCA|nr:hypothetical protein [Nocardia mexicana]RDI46121.1 hypothetical protein DFR68_11222 [Nocardia mexicana]
MRLKPPTQAELRRNFEEELTSACGGGGLSSDTGLDMETEAALWDIARAYPDVPDALVAAAHRAFAGQLDGSNHAARRARTEAMFEEHRRNRTTGDADS